MPTPKLEATLQNLVNLSSADQFTYLNQELKNLLPYLLHQSGQSGSGTDFTYGKDTLPQTEKFRELLEEPIFSLRSLEPEEDLEARGLINYHYLTHKSDEELGDILAKWMQRGILGDSESENIAVKLVEHLYHGDGADFADTIHLSKLVEKEKKYQDLAEEIKFVFKETMRNSRGDFTQIENLKLGRRLSFRWFDSSALGTLIGGTQSMELYLEELRYKSDPLSYTAKIHLWVFDDFGINEPDITEASFPASVALEGMIAQWMLNNQRGYKPFRNRLDFVIELGDELLI